MIIDGKSIAEDLYIKLGTQASGLERLPKLGIIACGADTVIESFIRIKSRAAERLGVELVRKDMPPESDERAFMAAVVEMSTQVDGLIVQLPIPENFSTDAILSAIPKEKDVDGINPMTLNEERLVDAPVALAVEEILHRSNVDIADARIVVIGEGRLVGKPTVGLLRRLGGEVFVVSIEKGSLEDLKEADIIVSGAGSPGLITPELIKDGVVLIDAGTSEHGGKVVGDADSSCAAKASVFTPVPGGIGPIAVAKIFENLFALAALSSQV